MPDRPAACPAPLLICDACGACLATCRCVLAHPVLRTVAVCGVCTATGADPVPDDEEAYPMPISAFDHCALCGHPWPDGTYCPSCQDVMDEIMACPRCGRPNPPHGDVCEGCTIAACPMCHGVTDDPGNVCPACAEIQDEILADDEEDDAHPETEDAYPWCPHCTPDQGDLCPICTAIWDEYDAEEDDAHV